MQRLSHYEKVLIVIFYVRWCGHVGRRIFMAARKAAVNEETAKEVTAKVADTKTDEVKTAKEAPAAKTEIAEEVKKAAPKKPGRKPAAEKAPAKRPGRKPAAEKKAAAAKTETVKKETTKKEAPAKKAEVQESLHIQFDGKSYAAEELVKSAKDIWKFDLNQDEKDFKSVELYVKPEENTVYYVINGDVRGSFGI